MDSDLDIARAASPKAIEKIAEQLNLSRSDLILHGPHIQGKIAITPYR